MKRTFTIIILLTSYLFAKADCASVGRKYDMGNIINAEQIWEIEER